MIRAEKAEGFGGGAEEKFRLLFSAGSGIMGSKEGPLCPFFLTSAAPAVFALKSSSKNTMNPYHVRSAGACRCGHGMAVCIPRRASRPNIAAESAASVRAAGEPGKQKTHGNFKETALGAGLGLAVRKDGQADEVPFEENGRRIDGVLLLGCGHGRDGRSAGIFIKRNIIIWKCAGSWGVLPVCVGGRKSPRV